MAAGDYDAVVIGAGAGGLFTAALLNHRGYRTLVVERLGKLGGRASTTDVDGFKVNDGAIVIEIGGTTEDLCREVGAPFNIREPRPPILYRIGGKDRDVSTGGWAMLLGPVTRRAASIAKGLGAARKADDALPEAEMSTADWLRRYTRSEGVQGIFRNMCASVFAVSAAELPARVFLTYFTRKSAFKRFGFHPDGTIGLWQDIADTFRAGGGEIWLNAGVERITVAPGSGAGGAGEGVAVTGVDVRRNGGVEHVAAPVVVSDVGPFATLGLLDDGVLPTDYVDLVVRQNRPCAMIAVNFASREPLVTAPGLLSFAKTRRLAYIANFTGTCPEMAPAGWHLYVGTSVPEPAVGDFDEQVETDYLMADLRDQIPGFEQRSRILSTTITRDGWPPQRAVAGFDLPHTTPLPGLWHVGDAVKEYANGGTTACAETAQLVAAEIAAAHPNRPVLAAR